MSSFTTIEWTQNQLILIDQRSLPNEINYISYQRAEEVAEAIQQMVVRGAPAIGVTAAYGIALEAQYFSAGDKQCRSSADWAIALKPAFSALASSRPTAINLQWALDAMQKTISESTPETLAEQLLNTAKAIHINDIAANKKIGEYGAALLPKNATVYTHCNTGSLATADYGTALGVIRHAHKYNNLKHVYAGETRPWFQGSRLTCWELMQDNISVTLCTEGAAAHLFSDQKIDWIIVGADRIAANGDVANKMGTRMLAILARHYNIKFMVAAPSSTFDISLSSGSSIPIEFRHQSEVTHIKELAITPNGCKAYNPAFDITPADLIDVISTEKGIIKNPTTDAIAKLLL